MERVQETLELLATSQKCRVLRWAVEQVLPEKELIRSIDERVPEWNEIAEVISAHRVKWYWDEIFEGAHYDRKECCCGTEIRPVIGCEPFDQHVAEAVLRAIQRKAA